MDIYNDDDVPHGNGIITFTAVPYKVLDPGTSPDERTTQLIHEADENNEAQQGRYAITPGPDLVQRTIVVERADGSTARPADGAIGTWDHDDSGTDSSWRVLTGFNQRASGAPHRITLTIILDAYQA